MLFWQLYSFFYKSLNQLLPYQEHAASVINSTNIFENGFFLDAGCGTGNLMNNRNNIIGIDISESMIRIARLMNGKCRFIIANLNYPLPFRDAVFTGVYTSNVISYLKDPETSIREFCRVIKPGGRLVVATLRPSFKPLDILITHLRRTSPMFLLQKFFLISVVLLLNLRIVIRLRKGIYHGFEISSLTKILKKCGFEVVSAGLSYADQDVLLTARKISEVDQDALVAAEKVSEYA